MGGSRADLASSPPLNQRAAAGPASVSKTDWWGSIPHARAMSTEVIYEELSDDQIKERLLALAGPEPEKTYHFIRPLHGNADEGLIETVQNPEGRFMFGLPEIDTRIRGVGRSEFCLIVGYSHTGKTQLMLQAILHNKDRRILFFTPDEVAELVLMKLVCMEYGISGEKLEERLRRGDPDAQELVRRAARNDFKNLIVIDDSLTLGQLSEALKEAEDYWGAEAEAVVIDYLNLVRCDADDVEGKSEAIKAWTKDHKVPVIALHQGGRGATGKGEVITMTSGKYGGEQEALFIIGVRRLRDDESLEAWQRAEHQDTINISIVKNKRPPSKKTAPEGVTHYLDPETGRIMPMGEVGSVRRTQQRELPL